MEGRVVIILSRKLKRICAIVQSEFGMMLRPLLVLLYD